MSARNSRILQICMIGKHNILKFNIISLIIADRLPALLLDSLHLFCPFNTDKR